MKELICIVCPRGCHLNVPIKIGDVVIPHICGTDADLVACKNIPV